MESPTNSPAVTYPWWALVEGESLAQGDLLRDFPVVIPTAATDSVSNSVSARVETFDVILMTQSCDLEQGKVASVLLCPLFEFWSFIDAAKKKGENWSTEIRENLRRGNIPGYHLLDDAAGLALLVRLSVVDFKSVYTSPTPIVRDFAKRAGKRLRLQPPYREHLAQGFARFFMRVGLPADIAPDKVKAPPKP